MSTVGPGEIFDLGYQPYEGERTDRWLRRRAIWRDGIRTSLGVGRGAAAKIGPWLLIAFAFVPAAILIVLAAFLGSVATDPDDFELPSYAEYYEFAVVPLGLFAAVVAPLLLCPDRRDGVLALYGARPITPLDYVASRWAGFFTVIAAVACIPEAALFVWNALDAESPGAFMRDSWDLVPRLLAAAVLAGAVLTSLALFAASFTTRRAYGSIGTVATLFIGSAIRGIAEDSFTGSLADVLSLAALPQVLVDAVRWIFSDEEAQRPVAGWVSTLWLVAVAVGLSALLLRRTRGLMRG